MKFHLFRASFVWVPRRKSAVKNNRSNSTVSLISPGLVDIHFHGAFGIDLMRATAPEMDELALRLGQSGVAAFCPTTLSAPLPELLAAVQRIGQWIRNRKSNLKTSALPLGIHLEGPYINPACAGAHPPGSLRPFAFEELETLWRESLETIKIITLAPELMQPQTLKKLTAWAKTHKVILSLGHSQATEDEAHLAFDLGISGVTHGWNALKFHHRSPGPMGAALGRKDVYVELIADGAHLSSTFIRWSCQLHASGKICFVSDCAPPAATPETKPATWIPFGPLQATLADGAARLESGALAGGGILLPESFRTWVEAEAQFRRTPALGVLKSTLPFVTRFPLQALNIASCALPKGVKIRWTARPSSTGRFRLTCQPHSG